MIKKTPYLVVLAAGMSLSGCMTTQSGMTDTMSGPSVHASQSIPSEESGPQSDYKVGLNEGRRHLESITNVETPSLRDLVALKPSGSEAFDEENAEDMLRQPAMRDTAMAFGARGGLAHTSRQINMMLKTRATKLDQIYDFRRLVVRGPDNTVILPPVVSEAKDAFEMKGGGQSVRVADQVYEIIRQARFSPNAPLWHSYLIRDYSPPKLPPDEILPKTPEERKYWEKYVREGWKAGVEQANQIFDADMNRLERDYNGMARYKALLTEGKISQAIVAKGDLGVTGGGNDMRVNDRTVRITMPPRLQTDTGKWTPTITDGPASDYITPKGSTTVRDYPTQGDRNF